MKKLSEVINERLVANNSNDYSTVSYRPNHKTAAMIEVMCEIYGCNKANLFYDKISELLANYLLSSKESIPLIREIAEEYSEDDLSRSCIGILMEKEILTVSWSVDENIRQQLADALRGK